MAREYILLGDYYYIAFQLEDIRYPFLPGLLHHIESKVFKDTVGTILIGRSKCRFRNMLTS